MASPDIIDVSSILQPISPEAPTGVDLRENSSPTSNYQKIKLERNQARAAERQNVDGDSQDAYNHWNNILNIAPTILKNESKDLEVACWYTEALVRCYGFSGLVDAFRVIEGFVDHFWDTLHPMPDEFGIETRVSCLSGLNGEGAEGVLIAPIRRIWITETQSTGPFGLWQYLQALEANKIADNETRQQKISNIGFSLSDIEKAVDESSELFFVNARDDINNALDIYRNIGAKLDNLCGIEEAPPTKAVVEVLEDCLGAVKHLGKHKFPIDAVEEEVDELTVNETNSENGPVVTKKQEGVYSREDAFKQLSEIATYFRKAEPHSPVSYIIDKAVRWGNMPLNELIDELITDDSSRDRFSELTGVANNE